MKRIISIIVLILTITGCRNVIGPVEGNTPEGPFVVWFNGLSGFADAYFTETDTLITNGWSTGQSPNQILQTGSNEFAVLSSLDSEIRFFDGGNTGSTLGSILLPSGSNPYSFTIENNLGYATLLLSDSVAVFDTQTYQITRFITTNSNPSGVAIRGDTLFIGHGSYPDASSPGGVSVIDLKADTLLKWIDTGVNTHWLKLQPTGMLHCYSTTYQNDGAITVIDPETLEKVAIANCGGAPGEGVLYDNMFLSPDGWGSGELIEYSETGDFNRIQLSFSPTALAILGNSLYATSFAANMIYILGADNYSLVDSLQAGGEGPQGIIAIDPSN